MKRTLLFLTAAALLSGSAWAQTILFSDDFETDTSANWTVLEVTENEVPDYTAEFSFDYSKQNYTFNGATNKIPAAPNSATGATRGVKLTINNNDEVPARSAVSLFAKGKTFTGNYALRADMWINYNGGREGGNGSTEFGTFGINHTGTIPCGVLNDSLGSEVITGDGLWFRTSGEGGATRDFRRYEGDLGLSDTLIGLDDSEAVFQDRFPLPDYETPGAVGKRWVQVEISQRDGHVVWKINGYVIAEYDNLTTFTEGTIMIGTLDPYTSIADPRADNFVLFDNVRVVDLATEPTLSTVKVEVTDTEAGEPNNSGTFTITRDGGDQTQPLEVTYRVGGTATPGSDFATAGIMSLKATIPANAASVDIVVQPIDNLVGEQPETVTLTLSANTAYEMRDLVFASLDLLDDGDTTEVNISALDPSAYERIAEDELAFEIRREGETTADLPVNLTLGGTATAADYDGVVTSVTIPANETTIKLVLTPKDDTAVEGNETVQVGLAAGDNYGIGPADTAAGTIYDDEREPKPELFADSFDADTAPDWAVQFGAGNNLPDYQAHFAYDYSAESIPPSPHGNGSTLGLKVTVNKDEATGTGAAGINLYPKGKTFSGGFALRFDMFLTFNSSAAGTTEHATFGIDHTGTFTNRHGAAGSDGLWFAVETDGSASSGRSYVSYVGNPTAVPTFLAKPASAFTNYFPAPLYLAAGAPSGRWVDVEVSQLNGAITWTINGVEIFKRTDATAYTAGNIMLGYMDTFNSIGSPLNYVVFDNVRVVQLESAPPPQPHITGIQVLGQNVQITFTSPTGEPADFQVVGASTVTSSFVTEAGATIQKTGEGTFAASVPMTADPARFYRIKR